MRDINKIVIRGAVSDAPRSRQFQNGDQSTSLTILTDTESPDSPDHSIRYWHRITAGGKLGEQLAGFAEGDRVYVEGRLHHYEWTDRDGKARPATEIRPHAIRGPLPRDPHGADAYDLQYVLLLGVAGRGRRSDTGQRPVVSFGIGTQPTYQRRDGKPPETVWHNVVRFGDDPLPTSGSRLQVTGACRSRAFKNREGVEQRRTEILAGDLFVLTEFVPPRRERNGRDNNRRDERHRDNWGGEGSGGDWP